MRKDLEVFDTSLTAIVERLLLKYPAYRCDDQRLAAHVLAEHVGEAAYFMTAYEFLKQYAAQEIPSIDSIVRIRRMVQNANPETRGSKWKERHKEGEDIKVLMKATP